MKMNREEYRAELTKFFDEGLTLMLKKNADYAKGEDPFANFKVCETLQICSVEEGILVRITDKLARISNLIKQEAQVKDESILDTLQDLANYTAILNTYLISKKGGKKC